MIKYYERFIFWYISQNKIWSIFDRNDSRFLHSNERDDSFSDNFFEYGFSIWVFEGNLSSVTSEATFTFDLKSPSVWHLENYYMLIRIDISYSVTNWQGCEFSIKSIHIFSRRSFNVLLKMMITIKINFLSLSFSFKNFLYSPLPKVVSWTIVIRIHRELPWSSRWGHRSGSAYHCVLERVTWEL